MGFLDHLEVLRWHILRSLLYAGTLAVVAFVFSRDIFDKVLLLPKTPEFATNRWLCELGHGFGTELLCINTKPFQIINITMAGQLSTDLLVSFIAGIILAFPLIFWEFWRFIEPALYDQERRHARGAVFFSSLLFLLGVLFGYYVITPLSVHFLGGYTTSAQVLNQINLQSYISTVTSVALASGVIFELPVLIFFLSKAGIVTPAMLKKYRKHSVVAILTVAAIITPPDVFSQILVALPLQVLYELGIVISRRVERQLAAKAALGQT